MGVLGLLLLISILLYIPPVQRFAVGRVEKIVENSTGMKLDVGRFRLKVPLRLEIDNTTLITPIGDTLVAFDRLRVGVALWPLLAGDIRSPRISLDNAKATYRDTTAAMLLDAKISNIELRGAGFNLKNNRVRLSRGMINGVDARMDLGEATPVVDTSQVDTTSTPMSFWVRRLELTQIKFAMHTEPNVTELAVDLPRGIIRKTSVDLGGQDISVDRIRLMRGDYSYLTGPVVSQKPEPAVEPDSAADTLPWTVKVGSVELVDNRGAYGSLTGKPAPGFDPQHIQADSIQLLVEDVYYSGSDISAGIRHMKLQERSGLRVTKGEGDFSMTGKGISLEKFELATGNSDIKASAHVGTGIMEMSPFAPLTANISAAIGPGDIYLLVPVDATVKRALMGKNLTVDGDFSGTLGDISINRLAAAMPGYLQFNAQGEVRSVTDTDNLSGRLSFDGEMRRLGFLKGFIADTALRRRIGFPRRMTIAGRASFTPSVYELPQFTLTADEGRIDMDARLDLRDSSYMAGLNIIDFPLYTFLPADSLGVATLNLSAEGHGFDPMDNMAAGLALIVDRLDYNNYDFAPLTLSASISDGQIAGNIDSHSDALVFTMGIGGEISPEKYTAHITGDIGKADLYGMNMSEDALAVTTVLDITASAVPDTTKMQFSLNALIDSTIVHYGNNTQRVALTRIKASSDDAQTSANIRSGDLYVDFGSPLPLDSLTSGFGRMAQVLGTQIEERSLSMNSVRGAIPDMKLTASAGRGNVLREIARNSGIDFRNISVGVSTTGSEPLRANVEVNGFHSGTLTLDTINVWARQRGDSLGYALRLANRPGNIESLALIYVYGNVSENRATLNVRQRNRADSVGFRFGLQAQLLDSMVRATFVPNDPILGYEQWSANEGNYVEYHFDNSLYADLNLQGPHDSHVIIESTDMDYIEKGAVRLDMHGINIAHILDLFPTAPPVGGMVSSDLRFGLHNGLIVASGDLGVGDFMYNRRRVADVDANLDFKSEPDRPMEFSARVDLDKKTAVTATGTYSTEGDDYMDFTVDIPGIPLAVANAFLPEDTATIEGTLDGKFALKGAPSAMQISGDAGFTGGKATIDMIGTAYGISNDRITIADGMLRFNGFGVVAPNNSKLGINGSVDIRDFSNMKADLALNANDFQAINSTHIGGSQIFGKASLDMNVTAKGPVNALTIRGDVGLSENTDVTYILRDQVQKVSDEKQDIVTFMVFADSLFMETYAPVENLRPTSSIDMLVGVNLRDGMKARVYLDELGENRIDLVGGGMLSYSMNAQGDTRLSGRYSLSGGTVYYKPPVISQKIFAVQDGSYVEFTGELADPSFNVKATQTMTIDVDMGSGAEAVSFDITIAIEGSLQGMQISFDVAAPNNATIQSQLMSMAPEQRMQQALSLLLYSQYTGPGATTQAASLDARDQLNNFLSKEVNQWARNNLKGVDFSLGIDSSEDETGNEHTDYSYSVSKSFFSDRVKVSIGGSISDNATAQTFSDNLVDDISLEYRLTKKDNMFLKVYHYNTQETIFEGEVTETGVGFLMRKKLNRLDDLFRVENRREKREARLQKREQRKQLREEEKAAGMDETVSPEEAPAPGEKANDQANTQNQTDSALIEE